MLLLDRIYKPMIIFSLFCLAFVFLFHTIANFDIWWQLKSGELFLQLHTIPGTDPFTYTRTGAQWIEIRWLFYVMIYGIYHLLGENGLIFFRVLVLLGAYILLFKAAYDGRNVVPVVVVLMLSVLTANERFLTRPHMASMFFICLYLLILERYRMTGRSYFLFWLPFCQVLWANMHGGFILGIFIVGCYWASGVMIRMFRLPFAWGNPDRHEKVYQIPLALVLLLIVVNFINPFGWKGAVFPLEQFTLIREQTNVLGSYIKELIPPLSGTDQSSVVYYYKIYLVLSLISVIANFRRLRLEHLFLFAGFLVFSLMARRNIAEFSFAVAPFVIQNISQYWETSWGGSFEHLAQTRRVLIRFIGCIVLVAFSSYIIFNVSTNRYAQSSRVLNHFGLGTFQSIRPDRAVDFIRESGLSGNMFNDMSLGGFLIWKLYPKYKVFVDGRLEIFGEDFFLNYYKADASIKKWNELVEQYDINYVILGQFFFGSYGFVNYLTRDPHWQLVYLDGTALIFVRDIERNSEFIDQYAIRTRSIPIDWSRPVSRRNLSNGKKARAPLENLFPEPIVHPLDYFLAGSFFQNVGLYKHAETAFLDALALQQDFSQALSQLGGLYMQTRRYDKAIVSFRKAIILRPDHAETHLNLAMVYHYQKKQFHEAEEEYKKAISYDRKLIPAYTNLGFLYSDDLNEPRKALKYFSESLRINPFQKDAARIKHTMGRIRSAGQ